MTGYKARNFVPLRNMIVGFLTRPAAAGLVRSRDLLDIILSGQVTRQQTKEYMTGSKIGFGKIAINKGRLTQRSLIQNYSISRQIA
jgi:hypothetical protein